MPFVSEVIEQKDGTKATKFTKKYTPLLADILTHPYDYFGFKLRIETKEESMHIHIYFDS